MKSERADTERIEKLLRENGLLEAKTKVGNILKKKDAPFVRKASKETYDTVNSEISRLVGELKTSMVMRCSRIKDKTSRKTCQHALKKQVYDRIDSLKGQCFNSKNHQKRCLRRINTMLNYLKKELGS